jgi:hypothetical protein
MVYCPECGMTLPEEEIDEDSMDEGSDLEPDIDEGLIPSMVGDEMGEETLHDEEMDTDMDLMGPDEDDIEPPSMDDDL